MKKLNLPLLLFLVVGSIGLLLGIYLLHGYQINRIADNLAVRADQAQEDRDLLERMRLLRRYLVYRPKDVEQFKDLLTVSKEAFEATPSDPELRKVLFGLYQPLQRAVIEHPEDPQLRREASQFALSVYASTKSDKGHYLKEAMDHLEQLEALGELTSQDQVALAQCKLAMNEKTTAIQKLSELIGFDPASHTFDVAQAKDPKEISAYVVLAKIYRDQNGATKDEDGKIPDLIIAQMIQENQASPDAYLRRAALSYNRTDDPERTQKTMADINKALDLDPDSERLTVAAAQICWETDDLAKAQSLLESGVSKLEAGDNKLEVGTAKYRYARQMYSMLADMAAQQQDLERSKSYIERGLGRLKLDPELMFKRANIEIDLGEIPAAKQTLARLGQQLGPRADTTPILEILRARLGMVDGKFAEAAGKLEKQRSLLSQSSGTERYLRNIYRYLVTCYLRTGQGHLALKYQKLLGNTAVTLFDDAAALVRQGRYGEAISLFEELGKSDDLTDMGRQMVVDGILNARVKQQLQLPKEQRDWTEVDRLAAIWLRRDGLSESVREVFRINQLRRKGELAQARAQAEQLIQRYPENINYWMLHNELQTDNGIGLNILDQVEQRFGDSVALRLARAKRILQASGDQVAARLQQLEQNPDHFTVQDQTRLWNGLANGYAVAEKYDKAIEAARHLLELDPENVALLNAISVWAYESDDLPVMDEMLATLEQLIGKDTGQWQVAQGRRLLWLFSQGQRDKGTLNEVRHLIEQVLNQQPNSAPANALRAELFWLEENYEGAIEALHTAAKNDPNTARYTQKLIDNLMQVRLYGDARRALALLPDFAKRPADRRREIEFLAREDPDAALAKARRIVLPGSQNVQDLFFLADIQQVVKKPAEALATLKQAVKVQPDLNVAWLKYLQLLIQQGQREEAEAAITQLSDHVPEKDLPRLLGQCQAMLGNLDQAREIYDKAIQAQPNDTSLLRDAYALSSVQKDQGNMSRMLDQIIALDRDNADLQTVGDAIWARRSKSQILAESGSYQDFQEATQLLEDNAGGEQQLKGTDLLMWLRCCADRPEAASRQRAVTRLTAIQNRRRLADNEKAVLAGLYKAGGRWRNAQQIMVDLLTANPDNQNLMSTYVQWLLERDQLREAAVWIRKLDPSSIQAIRFNTIIQVRQGQAREAAADLMAMVPKNLTAEQAGNLRSVALICEDLAKYNPKFYTLAEQQWLRYAKFTPNDVASLIGFYLRVPQEQKLERGFALCERQITKALQDEKPDVVLGYLGIGLDALNRHKRDLPAESPLYARVSKWFEVARKANVGELELISKEMYFYNIRSDFVMLEKLYRDFLNRNDVSDLQKAPVRNNLAFLLAVTKRGDEALQVIGDAIQQLGPQAALLDTRAMAHLSSGRPDKAIQDLQTIVAGGEASPGIYFHLALAEYQNKNSAAAVEAIQKAQSMGLTEADLEPPEVPVFRKLLKDLGPELEKQGSNLELSSR